MRILLVEDDQMLGKALRDGLGQGGYTVDWVSDGEAAIDAFKSEDFQALILDINLPGLSGLDVLKVVRQTSSVPVIIMTARDGLQDRVNGLDLGADDYIVKPFALAELSARLRAVHRRGLGHSSTVLTHGDIEIDTAARKVLKCGAWVRLTAREYQIAEILMQRMGRILSKAEIENQVYSWEGTFESNTIEAAIYSLRKKLGRELITTLRGIGYVINP
jgi:two-component system OmpR family response regulator/two-component system response regulator QseB